ncbi:hypothetical protein [Streptomyces orinoci]|uniref:Uncharacterized protein n=1 Tax=Streptomyces orinoci TaxID=67339 RepID=A0ABV3JUZ1_STRON|nr:hypothetical protein [Streptomyces orinoci]
MPREGTPSGPRLELDDDRPYEVGESVGAVVEGMTGPWDDVVVTSPALIHPLHLHPREKGASRSEDPLGPGMRVSIRSGISPGSYPVAASLNGRTVATARLKVVPQGPARIGRFVVETKDGKKARPGETVLVVLSDAHAAPDEDAVIVSSRALGGSHRIRDDGTDDPACKCDDGATVYAGRITVPRGTGSGTYEVTAFSHHGRKTTVTGLAVRGDEKGPAPWEPWVFATGAGTAVVAAGAWLAMSRRRRGAGAGPG